MALRGIRGAITVQRNHADSILEATREVLLAMVNANPTLRVDDLASAFFTLTPDLDAVHPAKAARQLGWKEVPLMCATEIAVPDGLPMCVRVLLHWNTDLSAEQIHHCYLGTAVALRPDWVEK
ncbi:MAG: chorismate mutase [Chloroflexi bacterium HGW-Chloroflexi-10]|nr:MAG: chorismate mutase [Chloroflexi bacterium HGW-Chloroflexi-10]